jgi:hypothetical protein
MCVGSLIFGSSGSACASGGGVLEGGCRGLVAGGAGLQRRRRGAAAGRPRRCAAALAAAAGCGAGVSGHGAMNCSELVQWPWRSACSWGGQCVEGVGCVCSPGFAGAGDLWLLENDCQLYRPALHSCWGICLAITVAALVVRVALAVREGVLGAPLRAKRKRGVLGDPSMAAHLSGLVCELGQLQAALYKWHFQDEFVGSSWRSILPLAIGSTIWWCDFLLSKSHWYILTSLSTSQAPVLRDALAMYQRRHMRVKVLALACVALIFELPAIVLVLGGPGASNAAAITHEVLLSVWQLILWLFWRRLLGIFRESLEAALTLAPSGSTDESLAHLLKRVRWFEGQLGLKFIVPQLALTTLIVAWPFARSLTPFMFPFIFVQGLCINLLFIRMQFKPRSMYPRRRVFSEERTAGSTDRDRSIAAADSKAGSKVRAAHGPLGISSASSAQVAPAPEESSVAPDDAVIQRS